MRQRQQNSKRTNCQDFGKKFQTKKLTQTNQLIKPSKKFHNALAVADSNNPLINKLKLKNTKNQNSLQKPNISPDTQWSER